MLHRSLLRPPLTSSLVGRRQLSASTGVILVSAMNSRTNSIGSSTLKAFEMKLKLPPMAVQNSSARALAWSALPELSPSPLGAFCLIMRELTQLREELPLLTVAQPHFGHLLGFHWILTGSLPDSPSPPFTSSCVEWKIFRHSSELCSLLKETPNRIQLNKSTLSSPSSTALTKHSVSFSVSGRFWLALHSFIKSLAS
uniref:Uncharacterized protein n=1 Tax=Kalanchoe fedtschenkoi TaxID=63787 RepID=A0A7N1A4S2_KALFE